MSLTLDSSIAQLPRIGDKYTKKFQKLGISTIRDLLFHFPHRYDDFSKVSVIKELVVNEVATVQGKVLSIKNASTFRRGLTITEALIEDKTGAVKAVWFNQPFIEQNLKKDTNVSLAGKFIAGKNGPHFSNPSYETILLGKILTHTAGLIPIYSETFGLTSKLIRYAQKLIAPLVKEVEEYLPAEIIKGQKLSPLKTALQEIHFPKNETSNKKARQRLAFDELFLIQLSVIKRKQAIQKKTAKPIAFDKTLVKSFVEGLPFTLTNSQKVVTWDILQDISRPVPMNRLLSGDVGSGKTIVAAIVALETVKTGSQVAIMAPTELLAQQHFNEFTKLLKDFKLKIDILTGSKKTFSKETDIVIGTQALIQKTVAFRDLALTIVDEQHRFGVKQRAAIQQNIMKIKDKTPKTIPHFLTLTATPIPRTLALTIYGDLDVSLLKEMPKNRKEIITKIVTSANRQKAYQFIHQQVKQGRQVFVICPLIEESEKLEVKSVTQEYEKLSKEIFPDLKIAMLHGRMKSEEKQKIMEDFSAQGRSASGGKAKKTDILVSTSVIEIGIDIPNATVMMIEGSERFGLAQLHQFRGRVGRGEHQSYCFLFSDNQTAKTNARLKALLTCKNGFELAEKDLKIRGGGELYGLRQSGLPDLAMANLENVELIEQTRKEANNLLENDSELKNHPLLQQKLTRFNQVLHPE